MPRLPKKQPLDKAAVTQRVSALASRANLAVASDADYQLESRFFEQFQAQDFTHREDKHNLRKTVLVSLFCLTCFWLLAVIAFVAWTALSPSIADRQAVVALYSDVSEFAGKTTNAIRLPTLPKYCPILFHLSDSVLIAFITSTTVAVLGLFLTAAKWLYAEQSAVKVKG